MNKCLFCNKSGNKKCAQCHLIDYCSKECQVAVYSFLLEEDGDLNSKREYLGEHAIRRET